VIIRFSVLFLGSVLLACGGGPSTPPETPEPPPHVSRVDPSAVAALAMPLPPAGYRASALAIGGGHVCALREEGAVECWGRNEYGELGDGTMVSRDAPTRVVDLPPVVQITAGMVHTCARTEEGHVYCWGDGELGEIGDGALERHAHVTRVVVPPALSIASSGFMTCARIDAAGALRCWGSFPSPDPASGTTSLTHSEPIAVPIASRDVPQLAGDAQRTCALDRDGAIWCWGLAETLGFEAPAMTAPAVVPGLAGATELAQGNAFVCAALPSNVSCWGAGAGPILGVASADPASPAPIPRMRGSAHVAAGQAFLCAASGGETRCAGYGELVDETGGIWPLAGEGRVLPALARARRIAAGSALVCVIVDGDEVHCLGYRADTRLAPPS
jgi:hypothetical protein